jgi:hypothetical protein
VSQSLKRIGGYRYTRRRAVADPADNHVCFWPVDTRCTPWRTAHVRRAVHNRDRLLITGRRRCQSRGVEDQRNDRLTDAELHALCDGLFPQGFAGANVLAEIAPEGWEQSPPHACFHPSAEQRHEEAMQLHRNIERLRNAHARSDDNVQEIASVSPAPTLSTSGESRNQRK